MRFRSWLPLLLALCLLLALAPGVARADYAVEKARASLVRIVCVYRIDNTQVIAKAMPNAKASNGRILASLGSGFVIGPDGLIATNDHVASMEIWKKPALQALVDRHVLFPELYVCRLVSGGGAEFLPANVVWSDHGKDLALIRAANLKAPALTMNILDPMASDTVYAMGFPGAADNPEDLAAAHAWLAANHPVRVDQPSEALTRFLTLTVNKGEVRRTVISKWSLLDHYADGPAIPMIENDCLFSPGNSGGPLINIAGQVIGVNTAVSAQLHVSSNIRVLHEVMGKEYPHSFSSSRPSTVPWILVGAIVGATLIGVTGVVLAFRSRQPMGRTTMMGILGEVPHPHPHTTADEPPPLPEDSVDSTEKEDRTIRTGRVERTRREGGESSYETFELSPEEHGGVSLQLEGRRFAKQNGRLILGRSAELAHVCLDDRNISNRHAAVRVRGSKLFIEDLESSNGTRVNGRRLEPYSNVSISVGDTISLGTLNYRLRQGRDSSRP